MTANVSVGVERDGWRTELFVDNIGNEEGRVMQIAGHYTPVVTVQRPQTIGLRFGYDFE